MGMNKSGNLMLNLLVFFMALAILVVFVGPIKDFIDIAQGNTNLNCRGFVDSQASAIQNYSYNASRSSENLSCLAIKLYLPYLFLVFLIAGVSKLLYDRGLDLFSGGSQQGAGG